MSELEITQFLPPIVLILGIPSVGVGILLAFATRALTKRAVLLGVAGGIVILLFFPLLWLGAISLPVFVGVALLSWSLTSFVKIGLAR